MNPTLAGHEPKRGRGRLQLLLIIGVVLGPMLLASAMYRFGFWVPQTRSYDGVLIANGQDRAAIGVTAADPERRWELLVTAPQGCETQCQELVYLARQINIGLGREASRAEHALAFAKPLPAEFTGLLDKDYPRLQRLGLTPNQHTGAQPQLWIVDPHSNLVLRYDARVKGKDLLNDLRHLLKLSNIG